MGEEGDWTKSSAPQGQVRGSPMPEPSPMPSPIVDLEDDPQDVSHTTTDPGMDPFVVLGIKDRTLRSMIRSFGILQELYVRTINKRSSLRKLRLWKRHSNK